MEQRSEKEILDVLFEAADKLPEQTVRIERLQLRITLRGLTSSRIDSIRERCTEKRKVKGATEEKLNGELFNATLIVESTVGLEVGGLALKGWGDARLTERMNASGGEQVVRRLLLAGELDAVGNQVIDLSGYGVDIEDIKN